MKREPLMVNAREEKFRLPPIAAISGVMNEATNEVTRAPNAAPMTTATASSTTFPRRMKSRNSLSMGEFSQPWTSPAPPLHDRDPQGVAQQVQVGPGAAGDQAQSLPVLERRLSHRLRVHHRHARRGWRGARRARAHRSAHVPRLPDRGPRRRRAADGRRGGQGRQGRVRARRRPRVGRSRGRRRPPRSAAHRDRALLLDVQAAGGQGGRRPRLGRTAMSRSRRSTPA